MMTVPMWEVILIYLSDLRPVGSFVEAPVVGDLVPAPPALEVAEVTIETWFGWIALCVVDQSEFTGVIWADVFVR